MKIENHKLLTIRVQELREFFGDSVLIKDLQRIINEESLQIPYFMKENEVKKMNKATQQPLPRVKHLIDKKKQGVNEKIDYLNQNITELCKKLITVLNPQFEKEDPQNMSIPLQNCSSLVNDIERLGNRIDDINERITSIFEHLEL